MRCGKMRVEGAFRAIGAVPEGRTWSAPELRLSGSRSRFWPPRTSHRVGGRAFGREPACSGGPNHCSLWLWRSVERGYRHEMEDQRGALQRVVRYGVKRL